MADPIYLYDCDVEGVIVLMPTGVVWSNQTGGTGCRHPQAEGIFVPLRFDAFTNDPLLDEMGTSDRTKAQAFLAEIGGDDFFDLRDDEWQEAWVPVTIRSDIARHGHHRFDKLAQFAGLPAILTYPNSD